MKKLFFLATMFLAISIIACGQKTAPQLVTKAFSEKYPAASSVKWGSEGTNEWEAEFKLNGKELTASFDNAGKWLESETEVTVKELPAAAASVLAKDFAGFKTDEIVKLESPDLNGFEVGLKKGETTMEIVFDAAGKVIKKSDVSKEEKEEQGEKGEKPEKEKK